MGHKRCRSIHQLLIDALGVGVSVAALAAVRFTQKTDAIVCGNEVRESP